MEWKVTFKFGVYHIHIGDEWTLDNDLSYTIEPTAAERIKDKLNDLQSQLAAAHARVAALEADNERLRNAYEIMRYIVKPFALNLEASRATDIAFKQKGIFVVTPILPQALINNYKLAERVADGTEPTTTDAWNRADELNASDS